MKLDMNCGLSILNVNQHNENIAKLNPLMRASGEIKCIDGVVYTRFHLADKAIDDSRKTESTKLDLEKLCGEIVKTYQRKTLKTSKKKASSAKIADKKRYIKNSPGKAQWHYHFQKLLTFRQQFKHCLVPCVYKDDPSLARWVKRQRYHYYLYMNGKATPMKQERIEMLEDIGFIWHAQEALWEERLNELLQFKKKHGHCSVPTKFPQNQPFATWVKLQRRQCKLYRQGQPSYMSEARMAVLNKIGLI
eukprot:CAMPEP_0178921154 /NCGR_PEP_ID=MMETSP0786-20121207/15402_1 /TAXON_ID=186022 /ORGANISM="Thalassionema frauenfeldii, Strain CCMP 1798" /LENGTH=247 /DNA_ID=CAMNT_0020595299 /DNA_START=228 /DNA_END=971 /DNA_ORIENTATION=-